MKQSNQSTDEVTEKSEVFYFIRNQVPIGPGRIPHAVNPDQCQTRNNDTGTRWIDWAKNEARISARNYKV